MASGFQTIGKNTMTRQAFEAQTRLVQRLTGRTCSQVAIGDDDELVIDFGELEQTGPGEFDGEAWLIVECPWRLETDTDVLCGWENEEDEIPEKTSVLIGHQAGEATVRRPGFDLTLRFANGYRLRVFPDCVSYYADDTASLSIPWYVGGKVITEAEKG